MSPQPKTQTTTIERTITAPALIGVEITCPQCGAVYVTPAHIQARVTRDSDGAGALAVKVKAAKVPHLCDQMALDLPPR